jgi:hypothetical protein
MEDVMHIGNIQHRTNGTIDIDFYRREAFLLRREAMNKFFLGLVQLGEPLIRSIAMIGSYALVYALVQSHDRVPPGASSIFVSANVPLLPTKQKM